MKANKNRGWLHVLAIIFPYILAQLIFGFLGFWVAGVKFTDPPHFDTSIQMLVTRIFDLIGYLILLWLFMRYVDKLPFMRLGLYLKNRGKDIMAGIGLGFVIMALGFGVLAFLPSGRHGAKAIRFTKIHFDINELLIAIGIFAIVAFVEEGISAWICAAQPDDQFQQLCSASHIFGIIFAYACL